MTLEVGDTIGSRYQIIEELQEGGFGKIFIAKDLLKFNSKCVVKQFLQPYDGQSENGKKARELFQREAKILYDLEGYPQVPNLLAFFEDEECIVQELVDGESLLDELEYKLFDENQVLNLLMQILPVLQQLHNRGIFHRDIKPDNIMRNRDNNQLVLIDFGIAKEISELAIFTEQNTGVRLPRSTTMGTPGYQAPENFSSAASDLYSLGATCFYLLTGYDPSYVDERSWISVDMEVGQKTSSILKKLFEEDLSIRYRNAEDVLQDIRELENVQRNEKINFLLSLLGSTDAGYKTQAINDLAEFGPNARIAIPQLISILQEDDYQLHSSALNALVKVGEESVPLLAKLLENDELAIRRRVAMTLGQMGTLAKAALPQLIQALEDSDPDGDVRWHAVTAIGKIGVSAKEAIPALVKRLKEDSQAGVRAWALYALGRMRDLAKEAEPVILELLNQKETDNVFIAGIEALDAIGSNIDEIKITTENGSIKTAREWVLSARKEQFRLQEIVRRERAAGRELILYEFWRPMDTYTPPQ